MREFSKIHREKISIAMQGNKNCIGRKLSEKTKKKMQVSAKKAGTGKWNLGKKNSEQHNLNISKAKIGKKQPWNSGKNHGNWKGGITSTVMKVRNSIEYRLWREAIFARDNWICLFCGQKGGQLEADHIKRFSKYPELRLAIDNGRTLCKECHKKTDTYKNRK